MLVFIYRVGYWQTGGNNTRHFFLDNWSIQCQNWSNVKYSTPTNLRNSAAYADVADEGVTGVFVTVTSWVPEAFGGSVTWGSSRLSESICSMQKETIPVQSVLVVHSNMQHKTKLGTYKTYYRWWKSFLLSDYSCFLRFSKMLNIDIKVISSYT